ncbi:50S ribosomal protein L6 [Ferruginibacter yonginensis]|uniref:Large ribosomal subunit protein uL6 n=1 Tax=Ferruginibacter yonginensis TaxID=1310416 RepID=A0ABV8QU04_9BACT
MSRIGKKPVEIPAGVTITVGKDNEVVVKGPKGELKQTIDRDIIVDIQGNTLELKRPTEQIRHRAMHGLYRSLISNMVKGVTEGFKKELELVGVGYKAVNTGNLLDLALGYSHNIVLEVPSELKVATVTEKGKNPIITLESTDKQLLGAVCAKIRSLRKPEPYKGKGVKFVGEVLRRKAGKSAGK